MPLSSRPAQHPNQCELLLCHLAVIRALEFVGHRIEVINSRAIRSRIRGTPAHLIYTVIPVEEHELGHVFAAAMWSPIRTAFPERAVVIVPVLDGYVRDLVRARIPHCIDYLGTALRDCQVPEGVGV